MDSRKDGHSQAAAAARAGFSERTGRRIDGAPVLPSQRDRTRRYRTRQRVVDYRHLIGALIRKPQAFRHSVFRDELFPSSIFRRTWETLDQRLDPQKACRVYVG